MENKEENKEEGSAPPVQDESLKSKSSFDFEEIARENKIKRDKMEEERKKRNVSVKRAYEIFPKGKK